MNDVAKIVITLMEEAPHLLKNGEIYFLDKDFYRIFSKRILNINKKNSYLHLDLNNFTTKKF